MIAILPLLYSAGQSFSRKGATLHGGEADADLR